MAMAPSLLLSFLFALSLFVSGAFGRPSIHFYPCKTIFISYTFTSSETFDLPQIAAPRDPSSSSSASYLAVYRAFRPLRVLSSSRSFALPGRGIRPMIVERPRAGDAAEMVQAEPSFGISSLRERSKDILFFVAVFLISVSCGALTGAIMYLAWSLFISRYEICRSANEEIEDDDENPKKMGYIKISDLLPAKEGYEGN